jgi:hypothetical protein
MLFDNEKLAVIVVHDEYKVRHFVHGDGVVVQESALLGRLPPHPPLPGRQFHRVVIVDKLLAEKTISLIPPDRGGRMLIIIYFLVCTLVVFPLDDCG